MSEIVYTSNMEITPQLSKRQHGGKVSSGKPLNWIDRIEYSFEKIERKRWKIAKKAIIFFFKYPEIF